MAVTCQKRVAHFARNTREFYPKIYQIGGGSLSPEWVAQFDWNRWLTLERNMYLGQVRDVFLFSCYTALAFIDAFQLTYSNISKGVDGNQWIFSSRQKTDTPTRIPLLPKALEIFEKYRSHPKCINTGKVLPVLSNQKMNSYLKEIADVCGISKTLTFHIARHTFATTITLNNDVPIESVSKMLGHKSIKITQHYAKIMDKKVSEDMRLLSQKLSGAQQIA